MDERSIFMGALERESAPERSAYLDNACGGDTALRQRVEALLASHEQAGSFLRKPVPERLAEKVATPEQTEETSGEAPAGQEGHRPLPEGQGSRIGPYKLLQEIGEGGMGTGFLAEQSEPVRRLVALKIIKPGMDSKQVIARFEAERQALALMDHPSIARVLDGGTTASGRPYFVMELVKGVPVTRFCDERRYTPRQRLELFVPVCQAVQHAHQKGIIHRDLKPSNVLVCLYEGYPVPKVIDFGIAKATGQKLTERTMYTEIGQVVGTLEYMSPEQAELNQLDIDTRSDIYSLGVLLYELLTGSTPLDRKRLKSAAMLEVLRLIREEEPPRPSTRLSDSKEALPSISAQRQMEPARLTKLVRGELDWIVMKALEKDRNRRYETANSFAMDVQRYLADEPVLACPPSAWYRLRKFGRRHQAGLLTTAALLLVLILAGGTVGWVLWDRAAQRAARSAATERAVSIALARAAQLMEQTQTMSSTTSAEAEAVLVVWQQAQDTLAQAEAALNAGAGGDALRQQVATVQAQLEHGQRQTGQGRKRALRKEKLFRDLDDARLAGSVWVDDHFDNAGSAAKWAAAFEAYGLKVTPKHNDELARQVAAEEPEVRGALIEALIDWAKAADDSRTEYSARDMLALAEAADDNGWRKGYLAAVANHDAPALRKLSVEARQSSLPPSSLFRLAESLFAASEYEECLALLRSGRDRYPQDFWLHFMLGNTLQSWRPEKPTAIELEEAIGCYRAALALRPMMYAVFINLGLALKALGRLDAAIAAYGQAIRLKPDHHYAHNNIGTARLAKGQWDQAIAAFQEANRLKPGDSMQLRGLAVALLRAGRLDDAIERFRELIRLKPDDPNAHYDLGLALARKGRPDQAVVEWRETIRLNPDHAQAHCNLGIALKALGRRDEASAECRCAVRLNKDLAEAHYALSQLLAAKGQFHEALEEARRGHELGSRKPNTKYPSAELVLQHERMVELDAKLPAILQGKAEPASARERAELATLCSFKRLHHTAARFYQEAFSSEPKLADDPRADQRYNAACAAALAGCGQGDDAGKLDHAERARLRRQALNWLRADLEAWGRLLDNEPDTIRPVIVERMGHWLADADFAGVRGSEALAKLPEAERRPWQKLWSDVAVTQASAAQRKQPHSSAAPK
jgi:serine/threonine protein kinase/tetratricopeptide (TPR) repeat protein